MNDYGFKCEFLFKFLEEMDKRGCLIDRQKCWNSALELQEILDKEFDKRDERAKDFIKLWMEKIHNQYHRRYQGLNMKAENCPDTICKSLASSL